MASSLCGLTLTISTLQKEESFDLCQVFKINGILIFYLININGWLWQRAGGAILDLYCKEDHYHVPKFDFWSAYLSMLGARVGSNDAS